MILGCSAIISSRMTSLDWVLTLFGGLGGVSLIGQIITFLVFVWFVMKFVWPPIIAAMEDREKRIADGLAAAERGKQDLAAADVLEDRELRWDK